MSVTVTSGTAQNTSHGVGEFEVEDEEIENIRIKDIDDLVKLYDAESLREVIDEELATSQGKIIKLEI